MGWDAHSSAKYDWNKKQFVIARHGREFNKVVAFVKAKTGSVDGNLHCGGLDVDDCAKMLEKATKRDCWTYQRWDAAEVLRKSNWNFAYAEENAWAYWSAKKFLETCAKLKLTITFSW